MKRELDIDAARGLMLVWMTLTHLPTALTPWVNQPLGYLSASEGFIFLSALFTGRIYYRLMTRDGLPKMTAELLLRALRLYGYHVLLLLFAFGIAARYALGSHGQGLYNLLDFYFAAGTRARHTRCIVAGIPPAIAGHRAAVHYFSAAIADRDAGGETNRLEVHAQRRVRIVGACAIRSAGSLLRISRASLRSANPVERNGSIQPVGLAVGVGCGDVVRSEVGQRGFAGGEVGAANVDTGCGFGRGVFDLALPANLWIGPNHLCVFVDKWHLGIARLIDFSALAMVLVRFRSVVQVFAIRPLVLLWQASLQVFCTHFIFCFIGIGMMGDAERIFGWKQAALIVVTFAALLAVAKFAAKPKAVGGQAGATRKEHRPVTAAVAQR